MKTASKPDPKRNTIEAVILDMDGVITRTAHLHARAWKMMFDHFFKGLENGKSLAPLDMEKDYPRYFDGKPRPDGVRCFLASRNIHLPEGSSLDAPGTETIHGLRNLKNKFFLRLVEEEGVEVFGDTVARLRQWRAEGKKTAVTSFGKNCASIIKRAGLDHLFDVRVDGATAARLNLAGKPAPDIFLQAAKELGVAPGRAMVIEDALSGVQAGSRGDFALVVGVARHGDPGELLRNGADLAVNSLSELNLPNSQTDNNSRADNPPSPPDLPSALEKFQGLGGDSLRRNIAFFLDYDGTLAPIVPRPEDALMSDNMRRLVKELATLCTVAIVSGRGRADVENLVGLSGLIYAGSHGFDITGPGGLSMQHPEGATYQPDLSAARKELDRRLGGVEGAQVERKEYAIAVHYRNVPEAQTQAVKDAVYQVGAATDRLKISTGKKVLELRPAIDWHKGKAVDWIMNALKMDRTKAVPVYLGDDITDEDAFRFLKETGMGIGILVGHHGEPTYALYRLEDLTQVEQLLHIAIEFLKR